MRIRPATPADMQAVWSLIYELAVYEKAPEQVITRPESLVEDGFGVGRKWFECMVAEAEDGQLVGIALYYFAYSTWKGKMIYLDDIVVTEAWRGRGVGNQLMQTLIETARQAGVKQLRWHVLDWNEPAIKFYEKLGADLDSEWITCKLRF